VKAPSPTQAEDKGGEGPESQRRSNHIRPQ
jgi:hypothetical protein